MSLLLRREGNVRVSPEALSVKLCRTALQGRAVDQLGVGTMLGQMWVSQESAMVATRSLNLCCIADHHLGSLPGSQVCHVASTMSSIKMIPDVCLYFYNENDPSQGIQSKCCFSSHTNVESMMMLGFPACSFFSHIQLHHVGELLRVHARRRGKRVEREKCSTEMVICR